MIVVVVYFLKDGEPLRRFAMVLFFKKIGKHFFYNFLVMYVGL